MSARRLPGAQFFGRRAWTVIGTLHIARLTEPGEPYGLESQLRELQAAAERRNLGAVVIEYTEMVAGEDDPALAPPGRHLRLRP